MGRNGVPRREGCGGGEERSLYFSCAVVSPLLRSTSGAPKRDENSGELLVRFPEVSLPGLPLCTHILLTLVPVTHPSLSS